MLIRVYKDKDEYGIIEEL